jgi:hypothetical protein
MYSSKKFKKQQIMKYNYVVVMLFLFTFISGCMVYHYGEVEKENAQEFIGLDKTEVLARLGAPDNTFIINKKKFWAYFIRNNVYLLLIGERGYEHQMIFEFSSGKVSSVHYIEKGESDTFLFGPIK